MNETTTQGNPPRRPRRLLRVLLSILVLLTAVRMTPYFVGGIFGAGRGSGSESGGTSQTAGHITLEAIQETADLVVVRLPFQQLITSRIDGYSGGVRCVLMASGTAMIATDLERASLTLDEDRELAVLSLAAPEVITTGLDHKQSRIVLLRRFGLWHFAPGTTGEGRVVEIALRDAQDAINSYAGRDEHILRARLRAEAVLETFLAERGWRLKIEWRD